MRTWKKLMTPYTEQDWVDFSFYSANMQQLTDEKEFSKQLKMFKSSMAYSQKQSTLDILKCATSQMTDRLKQLLELSPILVTFHYGHYRLLPLSLIKMGFKLCIMISRDIKNQQEKYYSELLSPEMYANLKFIDAENPQVFFKVRQSIEEGYMILIYADGGAGALSIAKQGKKGLQSVEVLKGYLWVRTGFVHIAYLLEKPLCLMIAPTQTDSDSFLLDYFVYYSVHNHKDNRKDFVNNLIISIYNQLTAILLENRIPWEGWSYLHNFIDTSKTDLQWKSSVRYIPFQKDGFCYLMDKQTYDIYPLNAFKFDKIINSHYFI